MDSLPRRPSPVTWFLAACLLSWASRGVTCVGAQIPGPGVGASSAPAEGRVRDDGTLPQSDPNTPGVAKSATEKVQAPAKVHEPRREPSEVYRASIRKTLEKRRERRARRAQAQGFADKPPIGAIVPWPMPPALIIRHSPEVHGEVDSLLGQLRRSGK